MLSRCNLPQYFPGVGRVLATNSSPTSCTPGSAQRIAKRSLSRRKPTERCFTTTMSASARSHKMPESDSIFSSKVSAWDHLFSEIKDIPPLAPKSPEAGRGRRQAMTAREISAFDEMFDIIFDAASTSKTNSSSSASNIGIGRGNISDLFGKLRNHSRKMKWTTESDEVLDRKKEEMDMCYTDQQLLEWANREVFGESQKYEEAARKAILEATTSESPKELPMLQPPEYPHLLALLMRTFRDRYNDPNLTLAMFNHARHLSIASYVFGCSTQAYNELIQTRWSCFRDIKGVHDALEEMVVNGVRIDSRTRKLLELVRREVGQKNLWAEESEQGGEEIWSLLAKIENMSSHSLDKSRRVSPAKWDGWKEQPLEDNPDDEWAFDEWKKPTTGRRVGSSRNDQWRANQRPNFEAVG